jgi:hypothetical protein
MSSFSVSLTSGSAEDQSASDFIARLPQSILLEPDMEVGITFLQAPRRLHSIPKNGGSITYKTPTTEGSKQLPSSYYTDFSYLISAIKKVLPPEFTLTYDAGIKCVTLKAALGSFLKIDYFIARALGFKSEIEIAGPETISSDFEFDINSVDGTCFIYCSIVKPQIIDGTCAPLLDIISTNEITEGKCFRSSRTSYKEVSATEISRIEIEIRNILGEKVPFANGFTILTLHFRKRHFDS